MADGDDLLILATNFGSAAERLGIEQGFRIVSAEVSNPRPAKEWFYLPALGLLVVVIGLQRRRIRTQQLIDNSKAPV